METKVYTAYYSFANTLNPPSYHLAVPCRKRCIVAHWHPTSCHHGIEHAGKIICGSDDIDPHRSVAFPTRPMLLNDAVERWVPPSANLESHADGTRFVCDRGHGDGVTNPQARATSLASPPCSVSNGLLWRVFTRRQVRRGPSPAHFNRLRVEEAFMERATQLLSSHHRD